MQTKRQVFEEKTIRRVHSAMVVLYAIALVSVGVLWIVLTSN